MLTKPSLRTYVPGTPEVPYVPARTVCTPVGPPGGGGGGYWDMECTVSSIFFGWDNGPATWDNPGPFPQPIFLHVSTCRSVWVP